MEFEIKYLPGVNYLSRFLILFPATQQNLRRGLLAAIRKLETNSFIGTRAFSLDIRIIHYRKS